VRWIAGEVASCTGIAARVSALDIDVDDTAEVLLRHEGGTLSSVHMDMLDLSYNRRSRWVGSEGTIAWEWDGDVVCGTETLWRRDGFDANETYAAALGDFLAAAAAGTQPRATGHDGLRVLELCEAVTRAS
jgi:predicted dehydrogenase